LFDGRAQAARLALIDGMIDIAVVPAERLLLVLRLSIVDGRITSIDAVAGPEQLAELGLEILEG
jgi:RNA polymerase sigma-70 factor (ECF subfamily)